MISGTFRQWRLRQTFATPAIAKKAEHVEMEKGMGQSMLASIARNVREFEVMLQR